MLGVSCDSQPRDVDVRPGRLLIGPEGRHWEVGIFRQQASQIIRVRRAEITLTGSNRLENAVSLLIRVGLYPAAHDGLDFCLPESA